MTSKPSLTVAESSERVLRIDEGRVACPRRGPVDITDCWVCPEYLGLSTGHVEALLCGASPYYVTSAVWAIDHGPDPQA